MEPVSTLRATGRQVGLDRGVVVAVATSDGVLIGSERHGRAAADNLARAQQTVSRRQKGSVRRRVAAERVASAHRKVRNQRADWAHKTARQLVSDYDLIAIEDLTITNMVRSASGTVEQPGTNVAAKSGLNRSILDSGWGILDRMLTYKAEEAGREIVRVDPRHTSQRCWACGRIETANRVSQAVFRCVGCGHEAHADVNAAQNILRAGLAQREATVERAVALGRRVLAD
jgi:putative transposase